VIVQPFVVLPYYNTFIFFTSAPRFEVARQGIDSISRNREIGEWKNFLILKDNRRHLLYTDSRYMSSVIYIMSDVLRGLLVKKDCDFNRILNVSLKGMKLATTML